MYPRYDEKPGKNNGAEDYHEESSEDLGVDGDGDGDGDGEMMAMPKTMKKKQSAMNLEDSYPYDRLKVSSSNPVLGIDTSKREVSLSNS